ncbi:MAG: hypothetical protein ABI946_04355 [Chthoniobacterales bacterium]
MKTPRFVSILFTTLALSISSPLSAQDGWFFSAQPPIVIRFADLKVYFTNTGDKVLHGVTVTSIDKDKNKSSRVIIDTIEPHKTAVVDFAVEFVLDASLTCTDYSKPLPIKYP